MDEPDRNTKLEARVLAAYARRQQHEQYDKVWARRPAEGRPKFPEDYDYGFTIVCNNCGSMNATHGMWSMRDDYGYYLRCTNEECQQRIRY